MSNRRTAGLVTATAAGLAAVVSFVGPWEGLRTVPYRDVAGVPTVCFGETNVPMREYTVAECEAMFAARLAEFAEGMQTCVPALAVQAQETQVAVVSWSYNVGLGAACTSTLARLANEGQWAAACDQLPRWNKAGGRIVQGLVNRRAAELALCRDGVASGASRPPGDDAVVTVAPPVLPGSPADLDALPQADSPFQTYRDAATISFLILALGIGAMALRRRR